MAEAKIVILGVGGLGCAALEHLGQLGLQGNIRTVAASTSAAELRSASAEHKVLLGSELAGGEGSGGNSDLARDATMLSKQSLLEAFADTDLVLMIAGMGGGHGLGAAPVIAAMLAELKVPVLAFVATPFNFEGKRRNQLSEQGIAALLQSGCAVVVLPNDQLSAALGAGFSLQQAFSAIHQVLYQLLCALLEMLSELGLINLDFNDFVQVVSHSGLAVVGIADISAEDSIPMILQRLLNNPLFEYQSVHSAQAVLLHLAIDNTFKLDQFEATGSYLAQQIPTANLILQGLTLKSDNGQLGSVLLLACGIGPH
jgi:cell division protein FtsZ